MLDGFPNLIYVLPVINTRNGWMLFVGGAMMIG